LLAAVAVWWLAMAAAAWIGDGTLLAQVGAVCQGSNITYGAGANDAENPALCAGSNVVCQQPVVISGPIYTPDPGCDPNATSCGMSVTVGIWQCTPPTPIYSVGPYGPPSIF
jgi:hypothetical protein